MPASRKDSFFSSTRVRGCRASRWEYYLLHPRTWFESTECVLISLTILQMKKNSLVGSYRCRDHCIWSKWSLPACRVCMGWYKKTKPPTSLRHNVCFIYFSKKVNYIESTGLYSALPLPPTLMRRAVNTYTHGVTAWRRASRYLHSLSGGEGNNILAWLHKYAELATITKNL